MPVYWWKPSLIGEAETANGEVTMTVPNLANGAGPGADRLRAMAIREKQAICIYMQGVLNS